MHYLFTILTLLFISAANGQTEQPAPLKPREAALERHYIIEEVSFASIDDSITLSGELTMPAGDGSFPGMVLISGSGPQDRNEMLAGHRPFLILSDYLTRQGFAVLRYDDRGVGKSSGDFASAMVPDFAADAAGAMKWLKSHPQVNERKTGYVGHSEGGLVGPLAAKTVPANFLILLAAPTLPLKDILLPREILNARLDGKSAAEIKEVTKPWKALFAALEGTTSRGDAFEAIKQNILAVGESEENAHGWASAFSSPGLFWIAKYNPTPALASFPGPILGVYGKEDTKILAADNNANILKSASHKASKALVAEGLNHLFQPVEPGTKSNYQDNDISFDDKALELIGNWIDTALRVHSKRKD